MKDKDQSYIVFATHYDYRDASDVLFKSGIPFADSRDGRFVIPQWALESINLETPLLNQQESVIVISEEDEQGIRTATKIYKNQRPDEDLGFAIVAGEDIYIPANSICEPQLLNDL